MAQPRNTSDERFVELRRQFEAPEGDNPQAVIHAQVIHERFGYVATSLQSILPEGRGKALVFTKLEEAMLHALNTVAREQG